ncbi:MAG: leucyl/phenylalanyl-tRNA--protein transferase, partial [Bacteroidaceae bacterium]|nr:leucyl/phenylalanyl-tRNA--protein transferase [Bacteroidaceae bacterium]
IDLPGAWLGPQIIEAYTRLHHLGYAHSVEVWDKESRLVGGLYGVLMGRCFIGESMFSDVPSGSKIALIHLANYLRDHGGTLIDCQIETPHLKSMGGRYIDYIDYLVLLGSK